MWRKEKRRKTRTVTVSTFNLRNVAKMSAWLADPHCGEMGKGGEAKNNLDVLRENTPLGIKCPNGNRTPLTQRVPVEGLGEASLFG